MKFTLSMINRLWELSDCPIFTKYDIPKMLSNVRFIQYADEIQNNETLYIPGPDFDEWEILSSLEQRYVFLILFKTMPNMLNNPGYIVDRNFRGIVMINDEDLASLSINWKRLYERKYLPLNVVVSIMDNTQWREIRKERRPVYCETKEFSTPFVTVNLRTGGLMQWQLFITEIRQRITQSDLDILQALMPYFTRLLKTETENYSADSQIFEQFLLDILHGKINTEQESKEQIKALGWNLNDCYQVAAQLWPDNESSISKLSLWAAGRDWIRLVRDGNMLYSIIHVDEAISKEELYSDFEEILQMTYSVSGISEMFRGLLNIRNYKEQAKAVIDFCTVNADIQNITNEKKKSRIFLFETYACELYGQIMTPIEKIMLCPSIYMKMKDYDKAHNTQYLETLYVFLSQDRNLIRTAAVLHIHRNTLVYRIGKIGQIFNFDFEDPDLRLRFLCAYRFQC